MSSDTSPDMSLSDDERVRPVHLDELVELLVSTKTIEDFLNGLTSSAASELAKFDGPVSCGITVRLPRRRGPATVGSSDAQAAALDETQYAARTGPCLEALDTATTVVVTDAATETRWPAYIPAARERGMAASLSVPIPGPMLSGGTAVMGALNLYTRHAREFGVDERDRAGWFAAQAGGALAVAVRLAERADLSEHLNAALGSRSTIDQALGILMAQRKINADDAFDVLRGLSQDTNIKLRHVAAVLIEHVTGQPPRPAPEHR